MNKYFRVDINGTNNSIHCLFINHDAERKHILENIKQHKDPQKMEIKNKGGLTKYFKPHELSELGKTATVFVSDHGLYNDDTIDELKMKVIQCCKPHKVELAYDELYFYANSFSQSVLSESSSDPKAPINKVALLYNFLSKNRTRQITWENLCLQLLNYGKHGLELCDALDKKMYYYYDDLKPYEEIIEKIDTHYAPLSHYFTTLKAKLEFIHNPHSYFDFLSLLVERTPEILTNDYDVDSLYSKYISHSKLILENSDETLSTMNSKALYEFVIDDSIIHAFCPSLVSLEKSIPQLLAFENQSRITEIVKNISNVYVPKLPFVYNDTNATLEKAVLREAVEKTKEKDTKHYESHFNIIDLFNSLNIEDIKANYDGISVSTLEFNYYQDAPFRFPCEVMFKKVATTSIMPYVKYNPGKKQENLVRLYSRGLSLKGYKVPLLSKSQIQKLNAKNTIDESLTYFFKVEKRLFDEGKHTKTTRRVYATLTERNVPKADYGVKMVFNHDSSITYTIKCSNADESVSIDALYEVLDVITTPMMKFIQKELLSMGPQMGLLKRFTERNVEIQNVNVFMKFKRLKLDQLNFSQFTSCYAKYLSKQESIGKLKNDANTMHFMYKRISNYLKTDAIEASIIQFINSGYGEEAIVKFLVSNYEVTEVAAKEKFLAVLSQINVERTMFPNRKLRVKNNPGLFTEIANVPFSNELMITIDNIKSVALVSIIEKAFFSILSVLTGKLEGDEKKEVSKVCKKSGLAEKEMNIEDTNAVVEKPVEQNQPSKSLVSNLLEVKMKAQAISFDFDDTATKETQNEVDDAMDDDLLALLAGSNEDSIEEDNDDGDVDGDIDDDLMDLLGDVNADANDDNDDKNDSGSPDPLEMGGGADGITGMNLSNPNPFFEKMYKMDPKLFLKQKTNQFNAYSRMCPWNVRRQPVILTQEEKDKIDKESPGSYDKAIKYGSSKDNEYYYICPRYWCLKNNVSLTEEQVKAGECGGVDAIIPRNAKKVPPGKHIFEFYADAEHKEKDGSYIQHYPGFISGDKHPDGLCIPCCFKAWDSDLQKKRREECASKTEAKDKRQSKSKTRKTTSEPKPATPDAEQPTTIPPTLAEEAKSKTKKKLKIKKKAREEVVDEDQYIIGVDKFPLPVDRWGMLPLEIQMFLNIDNNECFQDLQTHKLKLNHKCILRQGVELHPRKSFVAALANAYAPYSKEKTIKSVGSMCNYLAENITLDMFVEAQNGSLVSMFFTPSLYGKITDKKMKDYSKTKVYKKVDFNNFSQTMELKRAIASFENFQTYLKRKSSYIDHEILWDLVSMPNTNLFPRGINLVILNIPEDDMTNNVEILCPSNAYSSMFYNTRKSTLVLIKKNEFYEPIYTYEETQKSINIEKLFNEFNQSLLPSLKVFLEKIKAYLQECLSKPNVDYAKVFKQGNAISDIEKSVKKAKGAINKYVMNPSFKIIGVEASFERKDKKFKNIYLPCSPITMDLDNLSLPVIMSDAIKGHSLSSTLEALENAHALSPRLNTQPYGKVVEQEMIVGIITNTNQFVPIDPPLSVTSETAKKYSAKLVSLNSYDERTLSSKLSEFSPSLNPSSGNVLSKKDVLKVFNKYKLSILEQQSFQHFRNKIKLLFQLPRNESLKAELQTIVSSNKPYIRKLTSVKKLVKTLVNENKALKFLSLKDFSTHSETVSKNTKDNVYYLEDDATLKLPKENLINPDVNNSVFYMEKIADELVRYTRVYDFILNLQSNVGYSHVEYNLRHNELVLPVSELSASLYDELTAVSKYYDIIYSYDFFNAQPQIKQSYDNTVPIKEGEKKAVRKIMIKKKKEKDEPIVTATATATAVATAAATSKKQASRQPSSSKKASDSGAINGVCKTSETNSMRGKWKTLMGTKFKSIIYEGTVSCSYSVIGNIINHFNKLNGNNDNVSEMDLQNKLSSLYGSLKGDDVSDLQTLLSSDGKIEFSRQLKTNTMAPKDMPLLNEYYLSLVDFILLADEYKLPIMFIGSRDFKLNGHPYIFTKHMKIQENDKKYAFTSDTRFYMLKLSGIKRNEPFVYELVSHYDDELLFSMSMFGKKFIDYLRETEKSLPSKIEFSKSLVKTLIK